MNLGVGLGFKPPHFDEAVAESRPGTWWEVHPENYQVAGGPRWRMLEVLRERHPLSLHSVSLSLASPEAVDEKRLAALCEMNRRCNRLWCLNIWPGHGGKGCMPPICCLLGAATF